MSTSLVRRALALTISAVLGLSVVGLTAVPATADVEAGVVTGVVTDDATGDPVVGVTVRTGNNGSLFSDETDENGRYRFEGLIGSTIQIDAGGAGTGWEQYWSPTVVVPSSAFDFTLDATPTGPGALTGTVTDRVTGDPILNASVSILLQIGSSFFNRSGLTDGSGGYAFDSLPLGTYTINVSKSSTGPGNPAWESAVVRIVLAEGTESRTRDIVLKPVPVGTGEISGAFVDANDDPVAGLGVTVQRWGSSGYTPPITTDAGGRFESTDLPAGKYQISIVDLGGFSTPTYQRLPYTQTLVSLSTDSSVVDDLRFVLEKYATGDGSVRGVLTDRTTDLPIAGANISLYPDTTDRRQLQVTTDSNGVWTASDLAYGTYYVNIFPYTSIQSFESDFDTPVLVISGPTRVDRVDSLASVLPGTGVLRGQIRDATTHLGIAGAEISLQRTLGGYDVPAVTADSSGSYTFTELPAGAYQAEVTASGYESVSFDVDVDSDTETINVNMTAVPIVPAGEGIITGTVVDSFGQPIDGAFVAAERAPGHWELVNTDSDGAFEHVGLPLTDIAVRVSVSSSSSPGEGFAPYTSTLALSAGTTSAVLSIVLEPEATISGVVSTIAGSPPSGVRASAIDPHSGLIVGQDRVDASTGSYAIGQLGTGDYAVLFTATAGARADPDPISLAPAYWASSSSTGVTELGDASIVTLSAGAESDGHDVTLSVAGAIEGSVRIGTAEESTPLPAGKSGQVSVYQRQGAVWVLLDHAAVLVSRFNESQYTITGLASGEYRLKFTDSRTGNRALQTVYSGGASSLATAETVTVTAGEITQVGTLLTTPARPSAEPIEINLDDLDEAAVDGLENQISAEGDVTAGESVTVNVGEEYAGEWVATWANSAPTQLADWSQVGADGTITAEIPSTLVGAHRIIVQDADQIALGWVPVTIEAPAPTVPGTPSTPQVATPPRGVQAPRGPGVASAAPTATPTAVPSATPTPLSAAPAPTETPEPTAEAPTAEPPIPPLLLLAIVLGGVLVLGVGGGVVWRVARRP